MSNPSIIPYGTLLVDALQWPVKIPWLIVTGDVGKETLMLAAAAAAGAYFAPQVVPQYNKWLVMYAGGIAGTFVGSVVGSKEGWGTY